VVLKKLFVLILPKVVVSILFCHVLKGLKIIDANLENFKVLEIKHWLKFLIFVFGQ